MISTKYFFILRGCFFIGVIKVIILMIGAKRCIKATCHDLYAANFKRK